ncbi:MAG: hypothetical protein HN919_00960 [Verrucomicrobia bacterium]|nr:hypothetical protein [Verrucomicrobiota bacterium]
MKVFVTVDVDVYYTGDYALEARGHGLGVDYILGVCERYGIPSTFFVEAMGGTRWGMGQLRELCKLILSAGQEVQLHLHPSVAVIPGFEAYSDALWQYDLETQSMLLRRGIDLLVDCGVTPQAFRAGNLAANAVTLHAMEQAGIRLGSNRDLDLKSSIDSQLNDLFSVINDVSRSGDVTDVPVSVMRSSLPMLDGPFRHLEVCALSAAEMIDAIKKLHAVGTQCVTILTHPKEFFVIAGGKTLAIHKNRRRFESLMAFLSGWDAVQAEVFSAAGSIDPLPEPSRPMPRLSMIKSMMRLTSQVHYRVVTRKRLLRQRGTSQ